MDNIFLESVSRNSDFKNNISHNILNGFISAKEVEKAFKKIKKSKSPGIDGIPVEFILSNPKLFIPILQGLFNNVLNSGTYPENWVEGIITPIFKSGSNLNPENYRKVTILPALAKLFDSVLDNCLKFKNSVFADDDPFKLVLGKIVEP